MTTNILKDGMNADMYIDKEEFELGRKFARLNFKSQMIWWTLDVANLNASNVGEIKLKADVTTVSSDVFVV